MIENSSIYSLKLDIMKLKKRSEFDAVRGRRSKGFYVNSLGIWVCMHTARGEKWVNLTSLWMLCVKY